MKESHPVCLDQRLDIALFSAAIADALWLEDAGVLVPTAEELPQDAERAALELGLSPDLALVLVREASGKVDLAERNRVGKGGELALLSWLDNETYADVDHVAAVSDGFGFDIAVRATSFTGHLEVKSTTRRGRLIIYLSRHEFETMKSDRHWQLVAVRIDKDLELRSIATVSREWIHCSVPKDQDLHGRWESVRLHVPPQSLVSGIPIIPSCAMKRQTDLLGGLLPWPG
ncbi:protein NO VEIN domain-containing protein [Arthrobacter sp. 135MFCol5.1]|uniref:protein NO VEIN domain-containing protein n=1 Tax=Arthrobacter sp. 135MFCol5.1 TaxID=1158050 RepID=UPI001E57DE1F|nr:DUF3883 domain-containing protein [Arthrobacter sp. 135MFCol5.1]